MSRQRVIVGIGEALLWESGGKLRPGGLAVQTAIGATQLGHQGVVVSRIGQDAAAEEVLRQLRALPVNLDALQSDPDLATGRLVERTIGQRTMRTLTSRAAFDNLQWDFDLVDVAQQADAVVFGQLARREGQSQSIIKRFLAECTGAIRLFDLTNRAGEEVDRIDARSGLELAEGLVADHAALKALAPFWDGKDAHAAASEVLRSSASLAFVASVEVADGAHVMTIHAGEQTSRSPRAVPASQQASVMVAVLHGMLEGWELSRSLELATTFAEHAHEHGYAPLPLGA
jgi:sugar/nucleoside kinase (ribokinase family)